MNKKLFEMVYRESTGGLEQVLDEKELRALLNMGCNVYADSTGGYGESRGAKVVGIGEIKSLRDKIKNVKQIMDEEGYDEDATVEDFFNDWEGEEVVVLDQTIGQGPYNFYSLDSYSIEDLDLWASPSDVARALGNDNSGKKTCPKCGGKDFYYVKLSKLVMGRDTFDACVKCGTMIPTHMKK
jgi:hypothetical protein